MISLQEHLKLRAVDVLDERIERKIAPVGEVIPNQKVTTFGGETFQIHDLIAEKPLLLCFMRASWCPYCRAQVAMLDGMAAAFKEIGCEIVVISRETPEESSFSSKTLTLITDTTNAFGKQLGMTYFATDEITGIYEQLGIQGDVEGYWDTSELNVPATYIVAPESGRILFKHAKRDYTQRATGSQIIRELTRINQVDFGGD